jgi:enamine deaminase RidA (YjgF/YER057c/UK114 family)
MLPPGALPSPATIPSDASRAAVRELCLTETSRNSEEPIEAFRRLAQRVKETNGTVMALFVFGAVDRATERERMLRDGIGEVAFPVTWVEGASCDGTALAGVQAMVWCGGAVERIRLGGHVVGTVGDDGVARHCWLGGIEPQTLTLPRAAQVQQMFGAAELALDLAGFELGDVVRTWFYNDDILAWYGAFNRVRTTHYGPVKWRSGSLPASTGIGARNRTGAALTVGLRAWRPKSGADAASGAAMAPCEIASPLQCPAPAYGSSFSRAMEVALGPDARWLTVSGTASIHPDGRTAWIGDARRQVDLTMEVVAAILRSRGMDWRHVTRATAYYRHAADVRHFQAWQTEHAQEALPVVNTASVVCREDLLFEIEVDAVA